VWLGSRAVGPRGDTDGVESATTEADRTVRAIFRQQGDLITRSQALAAGISNAALRHKLRDGGRWKVVLPGIYLAHTGTLTAAQREVAAVLYGGPDCMITGPAALSRQGVRIPFSEIVDLLIPHDTRRQSIGFIRMHRTRRMPDPPVLIGGLRWAPPARAIADAARILTEPRTVLAVVADAVQRRTCTVPQLADELRAGSGRGSAAMLRGALEQVADGIRSAAEADLRKLVELSGLPAPMYNARLFVGSQFLAMPDAWWPDAGVAAQVDSREYHLSPQVWDNDLARHAAMSAHGIIVVHLTPRRIRYESAAVAAQLRSTYEKGCERPPLAIRAVPHDALALPGQSKRESL